MDVKSVVTRETEDLAVKIETIRSVLSFLATATVHKGETRPPMTRQQAVAFLAFGFLGLKELDYTGPIIEAGAQLSDRIASALSRDGENEGPWLPTPVR